jgi:hypothetical protein
LELSITQTCKMITLPPIALANNFETKENNMAKELTRPE